MVLHDIHMPADDFFDSIDKNGDGVLSKDEIAATLRHSGIPVSRKLIDRIFSECDINGDGTVTRDEFKVFFNKQNETMKNIFESVDINKDGSLSAAEFSIALKNIDPTITDKEIKSLIRRIDRDSSNDISLQEFMYYYYLLPVNNIRAAFDVIIRESMDLGEGMSAGSDHLKGQSPVLIYGSDGIALSASRTVTAPLDRLKLVMQTERHTSFITVFKRIWREDGFRGLFKGNGVSIAKIMPETAIKILAFDAIKEIICDDPANPTPTERLQSIATISFSAQTLIYPFDLIRTRLALSRGEYSGIIDCLRKVIRQEGWRATYKGYLASMLVIVPYAAIDLTVVNILKEEYILKIGTDPSTMLVLGCGAVSGMLAQTLTYPMTLVRTRLQAQRNERRYNGIIDCLKKVVRQEGFQSLYNGLIPNLMRSVPALSVSYGIFFHTKEWMLKKPQN